MPKSFRSLENYLLIDRSSTHEGKTEIPMATCCHCQVQVILNPLRTRDRNTCRKCMAYVCDNPGCRECNGSFNKVLDEQLDAAHHNRILF